MLGKVTSKAAQSWKFELSYSSQIVIHTFILQDVKIKIFN